MRSRPKHEQVPIDFINLKAQYAANKQAIDSRIQQVLEHGKFIMGPEIHELEERLGGYVGVDHCVGVSDGSTALLIALMALDVGRGDEVITTPFSFIATSEMISMLGATPVFVDIDSDTYNLEPSLIEPAITEKTKAILPVSLFGQCAELVEISRVAGKYGLAVIEDAAQSFGARHRGKRSCGLSTIGITSFFPSKPLGCYGDGGACFSNDESLANKMASIRIHGQSARYQHTTLGINGRLDTIQAAILLAKLDVFDTELVARTRLARRYASLLEVLSEAGKLVLPTIRPGNESVFAQYTIRVNERADVQRRLAAMKIPSAVHYPIPLHQQPVYGSNGLPFRVVGELRNSENAASTVLSLPFSPWLSDEEQDKVVDALVDALA